MTARLGHRWVNFEPSMDQLGRAKEKVTSLFCNNKHIFCGQGSGMVRVYTVTSGEYVRDLMPKEAPQMPESSSDTESDTESNTESDRESSSETLVAGGKGVVAAATWDAFVTVWSTEDDMDWVASYQYRCDNCVRIPCDCHDKGTIMDIKVTPHGKIVLLASTGGAADSNPASSVLIMKKSEDGWTVDDPPIVERCRFPMGETISLGCLGDYFVLWDWDLDWDWQAPRRKDPKEYKFSFGSAEINFEDLDSVDWCGSQGLEFDREETNGICGLILEPPFLILVNRNPDHGSHVSEALMVYQMDTYKVLKAFEYSRGRCKSLITNEYVVVQLQVQWLQAQGGDYILIYDKKMLLDVKKTAEEVEIQRIELNQQGTLMNINTTSLVFAKDDLWSWRRSQEHPGLDLSVLNFWVGRETLGIQVQEGREKLAIKEEGEEARQTEKKAKLS